MMDVERLAPSLSVPELGSFLGTESVSVIGLDPVQRRLPGSFEVPDILSGDHHGVYSALQGNKQNKENVFAAIC